MSPGLIFKKHLFLILICSIFLTAGILRLNDLTIYTPDSSRYLIFANSLAQGDGFVDFTQPEPDRFSVQAPLYPVILAPSQLLFPMSLEAAKVWTLAWGALAIVLFYMIVYLSAGRKKAIFAAALFAFNPLVLVYSSEALSEAPFLVFLFLSFYLIGRINSGRWFLISAVLSVAAVALMREAGAALTVAVAIFFLSKKEWKNAIYLALAAGIMSGAWYLRNHLLIGELPEGQSANYSLITQHFLTPPEGPLYREIVARVWLNLKLYAFHLGGMILYPLFIAQQFKLHLLSGDLYRDLVSFFLGGGKYIMIALTFPIILRGIAVDFRKSGQAAVKLLFLALYLIILLLYPVYDIRFLLPVLPLAIYYLSEGVTEMPAGFKAALKRKVLVYLAAGVLLFPNILGVWEILKLNNAYISSPEIFYQKYGNEKDCPVMFTQPWSLFGDWIRENLPEGVVIASPAKNLSTVIGNRKMMEIDQGVVRPVFESLLRNNNVKYILSPSRGQDLKVFHFLMIESGRFWFEDIHNAGNLHLYKVYARTAEPQISSGALRRSEDSTSVVYFVERGRNEMDAGNYQIATDLFLAAFKIDSVHPALLYQLVVCRSLAGDSAGVTEYYTRLYNLPQSLGYVYQARPYIQGMKNAMEIKTEKFAATRAVKSMRAASLYWTLGHGERAKELLNSYLEDDSTYFMGLLWGVHYSIQTGDTAGAKIHLGILKNMDAKNPVVAAFDTVFRSFDSLRKARGGMEKGALYRGIGKQYQKIELFEEALDEYERAAYFDPSNEEAVVARGRIFESKSRFRMSSALYSKALEINPENQTLRAHLDSMKSKLSD